MKITKLRFKNFFSAGNEFLEFDLCEHRQTVIFGKNGFGKSTMLSGITFALFGKTIKKVTKSQIVNSINNKNCLVEIEFVLGVDSFLVRRGIKPNVFEIYKNTELVDQSSVLDYQDYLESTILGCSYRTFCQTSIISIENYKPFMSLTVPERRDFIEDILDIKVFTLMNQLLKSKITKNKEEVKLLNVTLAGIKEKLALQTAHISKLESMRSIGISSLNEKLDSYNTELSHSIGELAEYESKRDGLRVHRSELKEMSRKIGSVDAMILDINSRLKPIQKEYQFFQNNTQCPTCQQGLHHDHVESIIKRGRGDAVALLSSRDTLLLERANYASYDVLHDALVAEEFSNTSKIAVLNSSITRLNSLITSTNKELSSLDSGDDITEQKLELRDMAKSGVSTSNRISELNSEQDYNTVMLELFKDTGIKSKIVLQYIPVINKLVNGYLEKLDFFVSFNLDNEFNETIKSRHRDDFTYSSFSAGEKQRIDTALLFTFRQLAKMRNSFSCNLLCMDEMVDSSLDSAGIDLLLDIFDTEEFDTTNLFIISHGNKDLLQERFSGSLEFYKRDGFSQIR
jgi:DNA repair exonuclease SbcCD ATPase subunit